MAVEQCPKRASSLFTPLGLLYVRVAPVQGRAYEYGLETLRQQGLPVDGLKFDADLVIRGLIMDKEYGNLIKVDRFG